MSEDVQSINSGEVGSLEDVLGKNDSILRPVSEPKLESEPEHPTEHYQRKKGIKSDKTKTLVRRG